MASFFWPYQNVLFCSPSNDSNKKKFSLLLSIDVSFDLSTHFLTYVTLIIYCLSFLLNGLANWPFPCEGWKKPDTEANNLADFLVTLADD